MKKHVLLLMLISCFFSALAEESAGEQTMKNRRFFVGVSYSFMSADMRLTDMSLHSVWYGNDMGKYDLSGEEIDELNEQFERNSRINALLAEFGWWIVKKPETGWQVNGKILAGIAQNQSTIDNKSTGEEQISFNSGFSRPCLGLGAGVGYRLTNRWGLSLNPYIVGTMGTSSEIVDNTNPDPLHFQAVLEHKFRTLVGRIDLQASFRAGPVNIFAGPGIYRIWSWHDYTRNYSEGDPGEVITEEMTTRIVITSWLVATAGVSWEIIPPLTIFARTGLGADISVDGGIHFNF